MEIRPECQEITPDLMKLKAGMYNCHGMPRVMDACNNRQESGCETEMKHSSMILPAAIGMLFRA
jgi:hypothetical protein